MKKQILKAFLVLAIVGAASSAMALTTISGQTTIGSGNSFTPSAKVVISISSISTSYTAGSAHLNGTNEYGTVGGANLTGTFADPSKVYSEPYTTTAGSSVATPTSQSSATQLQGSNWQ